MTRIRVASASTTGAGGSPGRAPGRKRRGGFGGGETLALWLLSDSGVGGAAGASAAFSVLEGAAVTKGTN